jgi:hypothetical protein
MTPPHNTIPMVRLDWRSLCHLKGTRTRDESAMSLAVAATIGHEPGGIGIRGKTKE